MHVGASGDKETWRRHLSAPVRDLMARVALASFTIAEPIKPVAPVTKTRITISFAFFPNINQLLIRSYVFEKLIAKRTLPTSSSLFFAERLAFLDPARNRALLR